MGVSFLNRIGTQPNNYHIPYSVELTELILECLAYNTDNRPTPQALVDTINAKLAIWDALPSANIPPTFGDARPANTQHLDGMPPAQTPLFKHTIPSPRPVRLPIPEATDFAWPAGALPIADSLPDNLQPALVFADEARGEGPENRTRTRTAYGKIYGREL